ncbi:MAG TPA: AI-2E family transporter [Candidatus Limousia pullorum]|uniref:AI-2E family transporter n=1 Tax=Candidatus Limousia pullorum TaxID=2840860 RepID=A0A9D1LXT6_9FIRM|nr:AI-2E family transporter [Candidatus Limousia pullorum]
MRYSFVYRIKNSFFYERFAPAVKFTIIYTVLFLLFVWTFPCTAPFFIGFVFAAIMQPVYRFLKNKLKFLGGFSAAVITAIIFLSVVGLLIWVIISLVQEIFDIINFLQEENYIDRFMEWYNGIFTSEFLQRNMNNVMDSAGRAVEAASAAYGYIANLFTVIPIVFMGFLASILSTYHFTHDFEKLKKGSKNILPPKSEKIVATLFGEGGRMMKSFFKSYMIIYLVTFLETLFIFFVLGIKYAFLFAVLSGVADIIPILGPGLIYLPLAAVNLITGNYFVAGALFVSWLLISIIREIAEPKIVSVSLKIHPLLGMAAVFLSLQLKSFWVFLFFTFYFLLYKLLVMLDLLKSPFYENNHKEGKSDE